MLSNMSANEKELIIDELIDILKLIGIKTSVPK
jgi:hypothetical protein